MKKCTDCNGTYLATCPVFERFKDETSEVHYYCPSCMPFNPVSYVSFTDVVELAVSKPECEDCPLYGKCLTIDMREEPRLLIVTVNGNKRYQGHDYKVASDNTITFDQPPGEGEVVHFVY